jgi:hypothetical protein
VNTKFIIYESAMCCSSGVCGPSPDKSLIELQDALDKLKDMGAVVERYSITGNPKKFRENPDIIKIMQQHQIKALPITTCDGKVVKMGSYPSMNEFKGYLGDGNIEVTAPVEGKTGSEGCCAGENSCDISCGPNHRSTVGINTIGKCC